MSVASADSNLPPLFRQIAGMGICARQHMAIARFNRGKIFAKPLEVFALAQCPVRLENT